MKKHLAAEGRGAPVIFLNRDQGAADSLDRQAAHAVLRPTDAGLQSWTAALQGPTNTPYSDGIFVLSLQLRDNHPFHPPLVKFITPIHHPNVFHTTGAIDLDILNCAWNPTLSLSQVLLRIVALLIEPNFDPECWVADRYTPAVRCPVMQAQVQLGLTDRPLWESEAQRKTVAHALPTLSLPPFSHLRRTTRELAVFLLWVAKLALPQELMDLWFTIIMPRVLLSPAVILARAADVPVEVFEAHYGERF